MVNLPLRGAAAASALPLEQRRFAAAPNVCFSTFLHATNGRRRRLRRDRENQKKARGTFAGGENAPLAMRKACIVRRGPYQQRADFGDSI
jgi:hypothetical protein